jgi:all-trans-8'-apo-beta-carotenal 15,15'-oxygenase
MTDLAPEAMLRVIAEQTRTVTTEFTERPLPIEGSVPPAIDGVYFRNGAGRFERGGRRYAHPFDGDGHVTRLEIGPTGVRYTNRFVRTREFVVEERSGRMRYRAFGTNLPGGLLANLFRMRFKNAANTSVRWHAGRLLALWEGGPPHRVDPATLATLGPESFGGRLRNPYPPPSRWLSPLLPFSAHPRLDPVSGELFNFGLVAGSPNRLLVYRVGADGRMAPFQEHALTRFSFVHDFAVTARWLCFLLPHVDFDVTRAALGLRTPVGSLRIRSERPMQALLIPRDGGEPPAPIDCGTGFVFHIAQAFDRADGALVLDAIRYGRFPDFDAFETLFRNGDPDLMPRLERIVIDPAAKRSRADPWVEHAAELPVSAPAPLGEPRRILYGVGAPPERRAPFLTSILRLDTETGGLHSRDFGLDPVGEPMLVQDRDGGEGWLLTLVHRAGQGRSDLLILRAEDLSTEASVALPHQVPIGFHGCWVPRGEPAVRSRTSGDAGSGHR